MNIAEQKIEELKKWFDDNKGATWEDYNKFHEQQLEEQRQKALTDFICFFKDKHSLEEWIKKFDRFSVEYAVQDSSIVAYQVYQMAVNGKHLKKEYQLPVLIHIYIYYGVSISNITYLMKALKAESKEDREKRIANIKTELKDFINDDNTITLYRGSYFRTDVKRPRKNERSIDFNKAISFSLYKEIAEFFACKDFSQYRFLNYKMDLKVTTVKIPIEDIIFYTNERKEFECIVKPICKGGRIEVIKDEIIDFDEWNSKGLTTILSISDKINK